jgi:hypothetical protein
MLEIVIPLHHSGGKEKTNIELRYALRGWWQNLKDPFRVTIIGKLLPSWLMGVNFIHQPNGGLKKALRMAAESFPNGFLWAYDDTFLIRPSTADEVKIPVARSHFGTGAPTSWSAMLLKVHKRLVVEGITPVDFSRPHCPYFYTKQMIDMAFADWPAMTGKFPIETWILSKCAVTYRVGVEKQYYGPFQTAPNIERHAYVNCSDAGWTPKLKEWLDSNLGTPSPFEALAPIEVAPLPRRVYFVHIPKTAGKSLIAALGDKLVRAHPHRHRTWRDQRNLNAWRKSGKLPVAAVVREPIDRAKSLYYFFKSQGPLWPRRDLFHIQISQLAATTTLSEFWEQLDIPWAASKVRHFKTQSEFLDGATVKYLMRFENLAEDFDRLKTQLNMIDASLPRENCAARDGQELSPKAEQAIRAFYSQDFKTWYP